MQHITGTSREQVTLFPEAIEDYVGQDNPVRFIDAFVDKLDMVTCGFLHAQVAETGRPPYDPKDLLKLYLYGYLHRLRSSRSLECETKRNIEGLWLLRRLSPDHKTISNFRTQHAAALAKVFRSFVLLCQQLNLFGAELVAIDSTKFKASNGQNHIRKRNDIEQEYRGLDQSIKTYFKQLDEIDGAEEYTAEPSITKEQLQEKIAVLEHTQHLLSIFVSQILMLG
jgi:transposase